MNLILWASLLLASPTLIWAASTNTTTSAAAAGWCILWEDDFSKEEDTLDPSIWEYETGNGCQYGNDLCGWGNQELQWYTDGKGNNTKVSNGTLAITVYENEALRYTSARLRTKGKKDWKFGKVEVRAKCPRGRGVWPAIWMLPTNATFGLWPRSGEIDIMELQGQEPGTVFMTAHFGEAWNNKSQKGERYTLPGENDEDFSQEFHVFGIEWQRDAIEWFIDGESVHSFTAPESKPFQYPFNEEFHLLINVAVGGNFAGAPDNTTEFPQTLEVDYVRVYQQC